MQYNLRTLLILLAVGPMLGAVVYWQFHRPSLQLTPLVVDVGSVQAETGGTSSFQIENSGPRTIHIVKGVEAGRGGGPELDKFSIEPGESQTIWIEWIAPSRIGNTGRIYYCEFLTSDPNRKVFEVEVVGRPTDN